MQNILDGLHCELHVWIKASLAPLAGGRVQLHVKGFALLHNQEAAIKDWGWHVEENKGEAGQWGDRGLRAATQSGGGDHGLRLARRGHPR
jgi:hypothetical protein